ncbi:hypothetical protein BO78DRAFT_394763 [Aspergillus sclerotiicarbonarius CBS 121057]|uniref:TPR-like protein n=1 Tax=Aspergillus sclerotiicarbonarius (strain CBS 121057 / IBT 28362) TaxID=1448318 RepID=A0A319FLK9_ASPSB|nr:hypothetical protein BO78DRAFT_394763 [Aspergillus sclerotiicarbonarius CBS 121057]
MDGYGSPPDTRNEQAEEGYGLSYGDPIANPKCLDNLKISHAALYIERDLRICRALQNLDVLKKEASRFEDTLARVPVDSPGRCHLLYMTGMVLIALHEQTMDRQDIEMAVTYTQLALFMKPNEPILRAGFAKAVIYRHQSTGLDRDVDLGIGELEKVIDSYKWTGTQRVENLSLLVMGYTARDRCEGDLQKAWSLISELVGDYLNEESIDDDNDATVSMTERGLAILPKNHPVWKEGLALLAYRLSHRYEQTGETEDLETAISVLEKVLSKLSPMNNVGCRIVRRLLG